MERTRKRPRKNRLLAVCLILTLIAVSGTAALAAVPPAQKAEGNPEAAAAPPDGQNYRYDPRGKLDPFKPFVKLEAAAPAKKAPGRSLEGPLTPLQKLPLEKIRVTGIAGTPSKRVAMVEDGGGKGFIVNVGTLIGMNEGRVIQILPDQIIVEERLETEKGKERSHRVSLKLHKEEGEGKP